MEGATLPVSQASHSVVRTRSGEAVPGEHGMQSPPLQEAEVREYLPMPQFSQEVDSERGWNLPGAQEVQRGEASMEYVPRVQVTHVDSSEAPVWFEALPPVQGRQSSESSWPDGASEEGRYRPREHEVQAVVASESE